MSKRIVAIKNNPWRCLNRHLPPTILLDDGQVINVIPGRALWITETVYELNKDKIADTPDYRNWDAQKDFYVHEAVDMPETNEEVENNELDEDNPDAPSGESDNNSENITDADTTNDDTENKDSDDAGETNAEEDAKADDAKESEEGIDADTTNDKEASEDNTDNIEVNAADNNAIDESIANEQEENIEEVSLPETDSAISETLVETKTRKRRTPVLKS